MTLNTHLRFSAALSVLILVFGSGTLPAEDWPRWRGPRGDGTWNAPKIAELWPDSGLRTVWKQPVGGGYAGVIVSDGRVYNADRQAEPTEVERLECFDADTGKRLWSQVDSVSYGDLDYGTGPRAAPTVHEGRIYTLGAMGQLNCRETSDGHLVWSKHLVNDLHGRIPTWGFAASPFLYKELLIVSPGAEKGGSIVALEAKTGETVWSSLSDESTYSTPILVRHQDQDQLICWTPSHIRSLDPATGQLFWKFPYEVRMGVSIATPIFHRGIVLVAGYWDGTKAIRLGADPKDAELIWEDRKQLRGLMSQPLARGDHMYLLEKRFGLTCFEAETGRKVWDDGNKVSPRSRNPQATFVWLNDEDRTIILNESGELILARLNPDGYHEQARTKILDKTWAHPAYAGRRVYARNDTELMAVELPVVE
jgi:outer membrane protein assembly factor BamB